MRKGEREGVERKRDREAERGRGSDAFRERWKVVVSGGGGVCVWVGGGGASTTHLKIQPELVCKNK